jgi:hypothetical protein
VSKQKQKYVAVEHFLGPSSFLEALKLWALRPNGAWLNGGHVGGDARATSRGRRRERRRSRKKQKNKNGGVGADELGLVGADQLGLAHISFLVVSCQAKNQKTDCIFFVFSLLAELFLIAAQLTVLPAASAAATAAATPAAAAAAGGEA